jgi:hypothetical protein
MSDYFSRMPEVYVRTASYKTGSQDPYVLAKNIFRRVAIRENIQDFALGFEQYTIGTNERPDQVAYKFYDDEQLDWVVLLTNNIINLYEDWPMEERELYDYVTSQYATRGGDAGIHHWETLEQRDPISNRVILKSGRWVPENFQYWRANGTQLQKDNLVMPITNYEFESQQNDFKRNIYVLKDIFVDKFINEFENLVAYLPNDELSPDGESKKTTRAVEESFISVKPTYQTLVGQTSSIEFATQQDFGNRVFASQTATINQGDVLADGSTVAVSSAITSAAGTSAEVVVNQYGTAGSSSGQTSSSSSSSGGGY